MQHVINECIHLRCGCITVSILCEFYYIGLNAFAHESEHLCGLWFRWMVNDMQITVEAIAVCVGLAPAVLVCVCVRPWAYKPNV